MFTKNILFHGERKMRINSEFKTRGLAALLLAFTLLCGCADKGGKTSEPTAEKDTSLNASTQAEPVTLEQALLKEKGNSYDQSDYKKIIGGEGIIDITTEFDCFVDHSYSTDIDNMIVSGGKTYRANFNSPLSNGKNILETFTLPSTAEVRYWDATYDGEMCNFYFKDGSAYKLSGQSPIMSYIPEKIDTRKYPLFKKVYRYSSDGKTLTDCTAEFLNADKVYSHRTPMLAITGKKVSLIDTAKYLDKGTAGWNWYRDMGWREYIAYDLDLSAIGTETPIRLFNTNILMTNCAFYEIVYASEPLDDNDKNAQTAPDGSVSPYYPAAPHLNCNLTLRKITLLTNYYKDVRNICTSHVITDDYTLLPISEIMTEGYAENYKYDCNKFYSAYRDK